jgi:hypothetical protein
MALLLILQLGLELDLSGTEWDPLMSSFERDVGPSVYINGSNFLTA